MSTAWTSISTTNSLRECAKDTVTYQVATRVGRSQVATDPNAAAELSVPTKMQLAMMKALAQ
jgi:hypothetical protein